MLPRRAFQGGILRINDPIPKRKPDRSLRLGPRHAVEHDPRTMINRGGEGRD
jgi:hypothetical protein